MEVEYEKIDADFYDRQVDPKKVGKFRAWYHNSRYARLRKLIDLCEAKERVLDIACGSAVWNVNKIPVIGIDMNEKMLKHGKSKGRLKDYKVMDAQNMSFADNTFDIIIMTEVLEHLPKYKKVAKDVKRILKPGGAFILSVPRDTPYSMFSILYAVHCFYRGHVLKEHYYKQDTGHVNHFSSQDIKKLLQDAGFEVKELINHYGFITFGVGIKNG